MTADVKGQEVPGEERDSQVSAMFDGELAEAECELLSRRLVRDEMLKAKWSRYALIGAALRADPISSRDALAGRVRVALESDTAHASTGVATLGKGGWYKGALGAAIAAGVAAASILMLRVQLPGDQPVEIADAALSAAEVQVAGNESARVARTAPDAAQRLPDELPSYVTPAIAASSNAKAPAQLANYMVAHSEYVTPIARLNRLSSLATSDGDANADQQVPSVPLILESMPDDADTVR